MEKRYKEGETVSLDHIDQHLFNLVFLFVPGLVPFSSKSIVITGLIDASLSLKFLHLFPPFFPFQMTSVLGTWLNGSSLASEYAAVAPTSPEADASFIHDVTYNSHEYNEEKGKRQMSKSSYVSVVYLIYSLKDLVESYFNSSQMKTLTVHPSQK